MNKPNRKEFVEEKKIDGKVFSTVNEDKYQHQIRKWEQYQRTLLHHPG